MARRIKRYTIYATLAAFVVAVGLAGAFAWRLSQGPVALTFLTERVETMLNANVSGIRAEIADVVLERDQETGVPRFRLRNIRLNDTSGNLIAMAPRAAVDVSGRALLTGQVQPIEFELIGAEIVVRRQRDGSFQFGFGEAAEDPPIRLKRGLLPEGKEDSAKADSAKAERVPDDAPEYRTAEVLHYLDQELLSEGQSGSAIDSLVSFRISQASVSLYDEANEVWWHAPQANLVLRRVAYGFALFADASIASGAEPWRSEIVASYKAQARTFSVSARVFDIIPADIAEDVFALSQFAQVRLPLSGQADVEFTRDGRMISASAEFNAAAGRVGFPDYISEPVLIDQGKVRFEYEPDSGHLVMGESLVWIGGQPTRLTGRIEPVRGDAKTEKVTAIRFDFDGGRPDDAPDPADGATPVLDRIELRGVASVQDARLELADLLLMSGNSGLRMRGEFIGGAGAVGVDLEGIARDLPASLIKRLWPPVVAGAARTWMTDNVASGRITDATFSIAIPPATLAAALDGAPVPDDMVNFEFSLADVEMRYFGELPPVTGASGSGRLSGDSFRIELENGMATLPSGDQVQFRRGIMSTIELAGVASPTVLQIEAAGEAPAVLELIDMEPLRLVSEAGFDRSKFGGNASVNVTIEMPLAKNIPDRSVRVTANARLENARFRDALEGMSIDDGDLAIKVDATSFRISGPVELNGTAANLTWARPLGPDAGGDDEIVLEAELDEADRERFGASLGTFLKGPVKVRVSAREEDGRLAHARVEADLTKADLRLDAIGWSRPAGGKVSAAFDLDLGDEAIAVRDLTIAGERLELAGNLTLGRDGRLRDAAFGTVRLDGDTDVAINLSAAVNGLSASVTGRSFDARPLIGQLFSTSSSPADADALTMRIEADVQRLLAHRGETITGVRGTMQLTGGVVDAADLSGQFSSGAPVSLKVVPAGSELRQLKLAGGDGGAALRAVDLYSKIKGGDIDFSAWLGPGRTGSVQRGLLVINRFEVENEVVLEEVELPTGRGTAGVPRQRRGGLSFSQLRLPFSVDETYIRIGDALVRGPEMGASAQGYIRKADGQLDIGGSIIPAYALNAAFSEVPLLGDLLTGGKGEGMFGVTYALKGSRRDPEVLFNPVSAIAPGIFRRLFDFGGGGVAADGTEAKPRAAPTSEIYR